MDKVNKGNELTSYSKMGIEAQGPGRCEQTSGKAVWQTGIVGVYTENKSRS